MLIIDISAMYFTHFKTLIPIKRVKIVKMHHLIDRKHQSVYCKCELGLPVDYRHYKKGVQLSYGGPFSEGRQEKSI